MTRAVSRSALAAICLSTAACAQFSAPDVTVSAAPQDCPAEVAQRLRISAKSSPVPIPGVYDAKNDFKNTLARKLTISVSLGASGRQWMVVGGHLAIHSYGGTFAGWTKLVTETVRLNVAGDGALLENGASKRENASVLIDPGAVVVDWNASDSAAASSNLALDVLVKPGGVEVHDLVLQVPNLWTPKGNAVPPEEAAIAFAAAHHPPGYGPVNAEVTVNATLRQRIIRRISPAVVSTCTATAKMNILDDDAVRQPYWDIGFATRNQPRTMDLLLFSIETGAVRAVFDSLPAAHSFLLWLQSTGATGIGAYRFVLERKGAGQTNELQTADIAKLRIEQIESTADPAASPKAGAPVPQYTPLPNQPPG